MNYIFKIVALALEFTAKITTLTYTEINIIVYYFLIPFSWLALLDKIFGFHYLKIGFAILCFVFIIWCRNFKQFSDWLFDKSVNFLNYFNRWGSNYIASSVWICVVVPILIYGVLIWQVYFNNK
jgi:uncharacterized membrane protein required for colicin V production